jgi:hypothetical protein
MTEIASMTRIELQHVEKFRIRNKHGSIFFPGETNLSHLDLSKVTIKHNVVDVVTDGHAIG